jgi:hypothetical protein
MSALFLWALFEPVRVRLYSADDPSDKYSPWQYKAPEEVEALGASNPDLGAGNTLIVEGVKPVAEGVKPIAEGVKPTVKPGLVDPATIDAVL